MCFEERWICKQTSLEGASLLCFGFAPLPRQSYSWPWWRLFISTDFFLLLHVVSFNRDRNCGLEWRPSICSRISTSFQKQMWNWRLFLLLSFHCTGSKGQACVASTPLSVHWLWCRLSFFAWMFTWLSPNQQLRQCILVPLNWWLSNSITH